MTRSKLKDHIREVFDRTAPTYDQLGPRFFSYFGKNLVAAAKIKPGSRVLDVATGRGALLFPAANAVGPSGCVVGIDISPKMVEQTKLMLQESSFRNVTLACMDAEDLQFPDDFFDYILCGFSLFFFPELARTLSEFKRVLQPGGELAVSIWGHGDKRWSWLSDVYEKYESYFMFDPNITPVHFHEASILERELQQVGYQDIHTISDMAEFVYVDADEWWDVQWSHVNRAVLESIHPAVLNDFRNELFQHLESVQQHDGIHQCFDAIYGLAKKEKRSGNFDIFEKLRPIENVLGKG